MLVFSDKLIFLITSVMTQALRVITALVMARLLKPTDYGLLTLVAIAPSFITVMGDCGIARALVQFRDLPNEIVEASGLLVTVALAVIYMSLWVGSGLLVGHARHDWRLLFIGIIGGVTILLGSIYTFQMACLNRDLKFKDESMQNIVFAVSLAVTGLSMALAAHWHPKLGVFALALQPLVAQIMGNVVIYHRHPFSWPRAFQFSVARKMLGYGWKVQVAGYVNGLHQSVVSTFVVMVGGTYGAGVFGRATQVSDMIGYNLMSSFDRLLHPLLRTVREDEARLRGIFVRGCIGVTLLGTFGWAWLFGTAPELIRVVLGPQWGEVPHLLRIFCTILLVNGLGTMGMVITHALGRPLVWVKYASIGLAMLLVSMSAITFFHKSLTAIATVYAICEAIYWVLLWAWAVKILRAPKAELIGHVVRLIGVALLTCGCICLVRHWAASTPMVVRLIASSAVGAGVFLGLALLVDRSAILDFRTLVRRRRQDESVGPIVKPAVSPLDSGGLE